MTTLSESVLSESERTASIGPAFGLRLVSPDRRSGMRFGRGPDRSGSARSGQSGSGPDGWLVNLTSVTAAGRAGGDFCTMYSGRKSCRTLVQVGRAVGMVALGRMRQ